MFSKVASAFAYLASDEFLDRLFCLSKDSSTYDVAYVLPVEEEDSAPSSPAPSVADKVKPVKTRAARFNRFMLDAAKYRRNLIVSEFGHRVISGLRSRGIQQYIRWSNGEDVGPIEIHWDLPGADHAAFAHLVETADLACDCLIHRQHQFEVEQCTISVPRVGDNSKMLFDRGVALRRQARHDARAARRSASQRNHFCSSTPSETPSLVEDCPKIISDVAALVASPVSETSSTMSACHSRSTSVCSDDSALLDSSKMSRAPTRKSTSLPRQSDPELMPVTIHAELVWAGSIQPSSGFGKRWSDDELASVVCVGESVQSKWWM